MAAAATFLTTGRVTDFTALSVIVPAAAALYAALQFVAALRAAILGLARMGYAASTVSSILGIGTRDAREYIRLAVGELASHLGQHREANTERVSRLAQAHTAILNAAVALVVVIIALLLVTAREALQ